MRFEWDPKKAATNLKKHGVAFQEAATLFGAPWPLRFKTRIIPRMKKDN